MSKVAERALNFYEGKVVMRQNMERFRAQLGIFIAILFVPYFQDTSRNGCIIVARSD
ncbi:hypothetical protein BH11GEM1_BH11GEM1_10010 [soil metagenome]